VADRRFAVVIGVDDPGVDATLPPLRYAQRDAQAVRDTLCDPVIGTFDPSDVTFFAGPRTSVADIKAVLRRIAIGSGASDLLLFYFAGHTLTPLWSHSTDVYLVTPDLDKASLSDDPDAGLRMAFLARDVLPIFAGTTVLILDCCRAGGLATTRGVDMIGLGGRDDPRHAVLAACAEDGFAREDQVNQHGVLTHHVLRALNGRAADHQGLVTFESMSTYVVEQNLDPQPMVVLQSRGTTLLTRPGDKAARTGGRVPPPVLEVVDIAPLESPLERHAPEVTRLVGRLSRLAREPLSSGSPASSGGAVAGTSRVEYLKSAVGADAVAYLSFTVGEFVAIDATARFDLEEVRDLLRTADGDKHFPLNPRWFGHVADDGRRTLWCTPLDRAGDKVLLLAVTNPPSWLVQLGQPGAKVLETIWRADFAASPAEAEIQVLTALRAAFGRLPDGLLERCLLLYREVLESFRIVFQPVITIGEAYSQVGVHRYEALARRSLDDQSAPFAMLQIAHTWGDHFVVERDRIILGKALSAYALAHANGPWAHDVQKPISVNVSVRSLLDDSYIETLRDLISALHLDANSVTLEISEQDAIEPRSGEQWRDAPHAYFHNRLAAIARDVGVAFALDDFGAGYASVSRMAELPLTQIKVDRAILHHRQALQELDLVVAVARDAIERGETHTARAVIVEGVDDQSPLTLRQIYKRGIKHVQGHITGERGAPELRRLDVEVRKEIAALVRGDDENRPAVLARGDHPGSGYSLMIYPIAADGHRRRGGVPGSRGVDVRVAVSGGATKVG
jgi:EAL domain-containing protein (putative c-di-GMP-specific phosphodiesterase class I)